MGSQFSVCDMGKAYLFIVKILTTPGIHVYVNMHFIDTFAYARCIMSMTYSQWYTRVPRIHMTCQSSFYERSSMLNEYGRPVYVATCELRTAYRALPTAHSAPFNMVLYHSISVMCHACSALRTAPCVQRPAYSDPSIYCI